MSHDQLLEIQSLDVEAGQLRHRRVSLPARQQLEEEQAERANLQGQIDEVAAARVEVATRQKRFEDEAQIVAAKADEDDARLYGGAVSAMRDLQALQDEIAGLRKRQGDLEDQALEAMEEAEALATRIADLERSAAEVDSRISALEAEIATTEDEIDRELESVADRRASLAVEVDAAVLADYERLRPGLGAATIVQFAGGNCVGCPSTMPAMEADRMKHAEAGSVLSCDECGRIVLR